MQVSNQIDTGLDVVRSTLRAHVEAGPLSPDYAQKVAMLNVIENMSGEDIMALQLCQMEALEAHAATTLEELETPPPPLPEGMDPPRLGPRMTLNGVDFTGTLAGIFMCPPGDLGRLYLLLMLLTELSGDNDDDEGSTYTRDLLQNTAFGPDSNGPC